MIRLNLSSGQIIILASAIITLINNQVFFTSVMQRLELFSLSGAGYILTFFIVMMGVLCLFLLMFGQKYLLKPLIIFFIMLSAVISYFNQELGIVFDSGMIRNVVETIKDNNQQEALELLSFPLILHVFLFGILPSIFIVYTKINYKKTINELLSRFAYSSVVIALIAIMILINFKYVSYFSRENRDLRVWITPLFPILGAYKYVEDTHKNKTVPFKKLGGNAQQEKQSNKRTVGIMVVGETARADHFSLNGYPLKTNPLLEKEELLNFSNTTSCGTSTAFSVPCMFSFLSRDNYTPDKADKQSNVLDVLTQANIKAIWIDNNSSCKGVCKRIESHNIRNNPDPSSRYYSDGEYYDEKLLEEMKPIIANNQADTLIVLHTLGSHGPAYHRRFPEEFAKFKPYCKKSSPQECTDEEVSNAYDNTLLYTDYILDKTIRFLKQHTDEYDSFLLYASDHGESLGENGIYLHGMPYFLAPEAQTHIPFIAWFSDGIKSNHKIDQPYSHDNLSHTLLGLFKVKSEVYQADKDIFRTGNF